MDKVYVVVVTAFLYDDFAGAKPVGVFATREEALSSAKTLQNEVDSKLEDYNFVIEHDYNECSYEVWETSFGFSRDHVTMRFKDGVWCEEEHK